jgi:hypothetical protein
MLLQTGAGYVARPPAPKLFNPRAWLRHTPYTRFEISYFCIRFSLISLSFAHCGCRFNTSA